jgi:hypothetical protein
MNPLESELRKILDRKPPPVDLVGRVQARIRLQSQHQKLWQDRLRLFSAPWARWAATGALAAVLVYVGIARYERHRTSHIEEERARAQLILALRITGDKLNLVQQKLHKTSERELLLPGYPQESRH